MILEKEFGSSSEELIKEIERKYSLNLPNDYIEFLKTRNGGIVKKDDSNNVAIEDTSSSITIDVLYGNGTGERESDISIWMEKYADELLENTIIIGDDLMHGFIVMICEGEFSGIYYWDDSYYFDESTDEENTYWIADSFSDFLEIFEN